VNGRSRCLDNVLKKAKPIREAGMLMLDTQPVCKPKYLEVHQITALNASRGFTYWRSR
jgi:hypothetical protein